MFFVLRLRYIYIYNLTKQHFVNKICGWWGQALNSYQLVSQRVGLCRALMTLIEIKPLTGFKRQAVDSHNLRCLFLYVCWGEGVHAVYVLYRCDEVTNYREVKYAEARDRMKEERRGMEQDVHKNICKCINSIYHLWGKTYTATQYRHIQEG